MDYVCSKCGGNYEIYVGYAVWGDDEGYGELNQYLCENCGHIDEVGHISKNGKVTVIDDRGVCKVDSSN